MEISSVLHHCREHFYLEILEAFVFLFSLNYSFYIDTLIY